MGYNGALNAVTGWMPGVGSENRMTSEVLCNVSSSVCPLDNRGVEVDAILVDENPKVDVSVGKNFTSGSFLIWQAEKKSRQNMQTRKL